MPTDVSKELSWLMASKVPLPNMLFALFCGQGQLPMTPGEGSGVRMGGFSRPLFGDAGLLYHFSCFWPEFVSRPLTLDLRVAILSWAKTFLISLALKK